MSSRNLVICDPEEGYAQALALYLMRKKELAAEVQVCGSISGLAELSEKTKIHLLFISDVYDEKERASVKAEMKFLLSAGGSMKAQEGEVFLYKYQSGEKIVEEMLKVCAEGEDTGIFRRRGHRCCGRVIGVFSPVHRIGKTSYALKLGEELAVSENVLYLNLEIYGGIGGHFEEGSQTISDVLYYARQEKGNLGALLATVVKHRKNLDYLLPVPVAEDVKEIHAQEWVALIQKILEDSIYDTLILDIDEGIPEVYKLLRSCTEIHMLCGRDIYSEAKVHQFENELSLLGYEDIIQKVIRKEQYDRSGRSACEDS